MAKVNKNLEIYIHFPFCKKKCNYCDFLSSNNHLNDNEMSLYIDRIIKDIKTLGDKLKDNEKYNYKISSIYFGGGTPSLVDPVDVKRIIDEINSNFKVKEDAEISMEVNPESMTLLRAKGYYRSGINRVSIGLQSIHNNELEALGRIHNYDMFKDALFFLRVAKFRNINVDLMYGIPNQTLDSWEETVKSVASEPITHISAYSLIIEEGTKFGDNYEAIKDSLPDEDTIIEMGRTCQDILENRKFKRYEISNYSKVGYECVHNMGYWDLTDYIGIGTGAASYLDGVRYKNTDSFEDYLINSNLLSESLVERTNDINKDMEEFMFLGLRRIDGISKKAFEKKFKVDIYEIYGEVISKHIATKMLEDKEDTIKLTRKAIDVSNNILSDFILD